MPERASLVGLDELFDIAERHPDNGEAARSQRARPRRAFDARWWVRHSCRAVGLAVLPFTVLWVFRIGVPFPLIAVSFLAMSALNAVLKEVADPPLPVEITGRDLPPADEGGPDQPAGLRHAVPVNDGVRLAVGRWDDRLGWGERDGARFANLIVPRLGELADERLRQGHGINRAADPDTARRLLGEQLWRLLHERPARAPAPRDVASIVAALEQV